MKKTILIIHLIFLSILISNAQENTNPFPISKGNWLIESNTGFGNIHPSNTGISFRLTNGQALWNVGGEAGYFVANRLALKLGLGFGNFATGSSGVSVSGEGNGGEGNGGEGNGGEGNGGEGTGGEGNGGEGNGGVISGTGGAAIAGIGAILSYKIGAKYYLIDKIPIQVDFSGANVTGYNLELGLQAGYAFFLGERKNISIEPGFRYSIPLQSNVNTISNAFQVNAGFAFHF